MYQPFGAVFSKMSKFIQYLKDTRGELKHVSWPTQKQATIFTILVVVISIFVSLYLGLFDFIFTRGLDIFFLDTVPSNTLPPVDHSGANMDLPAETPIEEPGTETSAPPNSEATFDLPSAGGGN